ncbi:MAG: hypothetical protein IPK08_10740 [Bacteroidetes bacterium]|nr:hypothetical protein [Bacteroidota bacterium]
MTIFFSWQSDLNFKNNKNFIEGCIKTAINEFNKDNKLLVNFTLDKDTSGEPGNPEIINTILNKIDNSRMFICDLSIINSDYHGRKAPNPNVIFELGYAIKSLGWEKIVCIVNQEFGLAEDLPFDIKQRRIIGYNLSIKDKQIEKKKIVVTIKTNLTILRDRGLLHDELEDYFKRDIDTEFLNITNHFRKIVLNEPSSNLLSDTGLVLNLSKEVLKDNITNKDIIGFHLFKNFALNAQSLKKQIDNIISVSNFKKEKIVTLVKFKEWLDWYNSFTNGRNYSDLFIKGNKAVGFKTIFSNNPDLPDRMILGKLQPNDKLMIADFGDIKIKDRVQHSTHLHQVNQKHVDNYSKLLFSFIEITNEWLDKTGGEFIVDTFNQFEMK